jgi:hypothetical protein
MWGLWLMAAPRRRRCRRFLPAVEPGDDVLDAGCDAVVCPAVVVVDDGAGGVASRGGDGRGAAVSAVAEDDTTTEQMLHGVAGHDDVVAVIWPAVAGYRHTAPVRAGKDLGVDAGAVVVADGGDRLVVHRNQGGVDDPRVVAGVGAGRSARASTDIRWWTIRSRADWLM